MSILYFAPLFIVETMTPTTTVALVSYQSTVAPTTGGSETTIEEETTGKNEVIYIS